MFFSVGKTAILAVLSFYSPPSSTRCFFLLPPLDDETPHRRRRRTSFITATTTTMSSISVGENNMKSLTKEDLTPQQQHQQQRQQQQNQPQQNQQRDFPRTFYRRKLPSTLISFSSPEGRQVFQSAVANGGVASFFSLIEQLQTQPEPAYCGLTTLVVILNALAVDPRRSWKGPWRWYEESMLNCCIDIETVKQTGITFTTFACLAKCQGLDVNATYASDSTLQDFRRTVKETCTNSPPSQTSQPTSFLAVSYSRKTVGQTGSGHFSPIGAYDEASDNVLLLDTARFKYGPHWIPLERMFEAMMPLDPDTGKSRGYVVLSYDGRGEGSDGEGDDGLSHLPQSVLFRSNKSKDFLRREYKRYLDGVLEQGRDSGQDSIELDRVISYWTRNHTNSSFIWELVTPQLQPVDSKEIKMVNSLRCVIQKLIKMDEGGKTFNSCSLNRAIASSPGGECCTGSTCNSSARVLEVSPAEAIYIVYLGSLPSEMRKKIIYGACDELENDEIDDAVREQLLAEAALISYGFEECDVDF